MKARTKIEKQVAASNEKLTVLSPKVLTWAVRKVAGHVCFRTSAHKCTCGDCGRHFDYEGKGKSVCCPHCGTRLQIKDTLKRTLKEAYYFSSLEVVEGLQVQRVSRLETTFRKGMPMEVDYWEACRLWLNAEGKVAVTARARTLGYYVDCFDWASEITLNLEATDRSPLAHCRHLCLSALSVAARIETQRHERQAARLPPDETDESRADGQPDGNHPQVKGFTCRVLFCKPTFGT